MHHPVHKQLKAAYAFYNVSNDVSLTQLMQDALILAKQVQYFILYGKGTSILLGDEKKR